MFNKSIMSFTKTNEISEISYNTASEVIYEAASSAGLTLEELQKYLELELERVSVQIAAKGKATTVDASNAGKGFFGVRVN